MPSLHPRAICAGLLSVLTLLFTAAITPAQSDLPAAPGVRKAPPQLLAMFDVLTGTVQTLQIAPSPTGTYAIPVLLDGVLRTMILHEHELRGPGFQLLVEDAVGTHVMPTPACVTFRGHLLEEPTTKIVASIIGGSVTAILYGAPAAPGMPGVDWVVQPVREVDPTAGPSVHLVYLATDSTPLPFRCGNLPAPGQPVLPAAGVDTTLECEFAIEADVQFYQLNGSSVTATQNDITAVMNQIEFIYDRDCDIQYDITAIVVSTTAVYTTNDAGTLLNQFATRWNSVYAGTPRDVAHLFTGRNLSGSTIGVATLATVCNLGAAYGLSQSRFSGNFNSRVGLTSHEVGHNWSAQHCNSASPCYIMCSGLGGCSGNVTLFSPFAIGQITSFAATRNCLSTVVQTPAIAAATPQNVTVFQPGNVVLTGTNFTGATSYQVDTQTFTSGFGVASDTSMSISMPDGQPLGFRLVRVTNPAGTSNSFPLLYTTTVPPKLRTTPSVAGVGGPASFDFGGLPGRGWIMVLGLSSTTGLFQGYPLLDNPLILTAGTFPSPLGIDGFTVPVPPGLGLLFVYTQILEVDALSPTATGTSNVGITVLLP